MYCAKCGKEVPSDSKFCPNCGSQVLTQTTTPTQPLKDKKSKRGGCLKIGLIIAASVIGALAILGLITFAFISRPNQYVHPTLGFSFKYPNTLKIELPNTTNLSQPNPADNPWFILIQNPSYQAYTVNWILLYSVSSTGSTKEELTAELDKDVTSGAANTLTVNGLKMYKYVNDSAKPNQMLLAFYQMTGMDASKEQSAYLFIQNDLCFIVGFRQPPTGAGSGYNTYLDIKSWKSSALKTTNGNLNGDWAGTWTNSLGESGNETLQLTDSGSGTFTGVWSGNIKISGKWLTETTFEFSGSTATRSYKAQGNFQKNNITLTYTATRLDTSGSYTGQERLTRQNSGSMSAITSTPTASVLGEVVAKQSIGAAGGTITIDKAGSPLNGFKLTVPAGALTDTRTFQVSYQTGPNRGYKGVTTVSPLITIDDGGVFANQPLYVRIPVKIPQGDFAMAFYYDANTGLEGMPLLAADNNSITVATCHFSSFTCFSISLQMLKDAEALSSGVHTDFQPGRDDWKIPNNGSYITTNGNCAGMSMTAVWYFDEVVRNSKNSNVARLNGTFFGLDPTIWQDYNMAYRLVSTVQKDYKVEYGKRWPDTKDLPLEIRSNVHGDEEVYNAFAFSMMITNQPQLIGVDGHYDSNNVSLAHEMVAYAVYSNGIMVDDPDDQKGHLIPYANGELGSFDDSSVTWDNFYYDAKGALVPWDKIGVRWQEFYNGTIGSDVFPSYKLTITDDKGNTFDASKYDLKNSIASSSSKVTVQISSSAPLAISLYNGNSRTWLAKDISGNPLLSQTSTFTLSSGNNALGVYVAGSNGKYVDFKWVSINFGAPTPTPTPTVQPIGNENVTIDTVNAKLLKQNVDSTGDRINYYMVTASGTATGPVGSGFFIYLGMMNGDGYALNEGLGGMVLQASWTGVTYDKTYNAYVRMASNPSITNWTFSVPIRIDLSSSFGYVNVIVMKITDNNNVLSVEDNDTHKSFTVPGFP